MNSNPNTNTNTKQQLQQPQQKQQQQQQVNGNMRSQEQAATTNASLVSSTNSLHSSTSSNSFNQNQVIVDNVTSLSAAQQQQQQHNSSHANIQQTSTHSISPPQIVSPSTSSSSSSISPASNSLKTTPKGKPIMFIILSHQFTAPNESSIPILNFNSNFKVILLENDLNFNYESKIPETKTRTFRIKIFPLRHRLEIFYLILFNRLKALGFTSQFFLIENRLFCCLNIYLQTYSIKSLNFS